MSLEYTPVLYRERVLELIREHSLGRVAEKRL